jgi:hypothetical protein
MRIGPTEFARMINTSKQNVYAIFKRKSIDTDQLLLISKVLHVNFFEYYMDVLESGSMVAEPASEYNVIRKDIMKLREELDSLKEKLKDI